MKTLDELKRVFTQDRFAKFNNIEITEVNENYSVCTAIINEKHLNANDIVHGGLLFTIADFAFGVFCNAIHPITVTQSATITYINPCVNTKYVTATAKQLAHERHNCICEVIVSDDKGRTLCVAQINGFIKAEATPDNIRINSDTPKR